MCFRGKSAERDSGPVIVGVTAVFTFTRNRCHVAILDSPYFFLFLYLGVTVNKDKLLTRAVEPILKFQAPAPTSRKVFGYGSRTIWSKNRKILYCMCPCLPHKLPCGSGTQISGSGSTI